METNESRVRLSNDDVRRWCQRRGLEQPPVVSMPAHFGTVPSTIGDWSNVLGPDVQYRDIQGGRHFNTERDMQLGWQYVQWSRDTEYPQIVGGRSTMSVVYRGDGGGLYRYNQSASIMDWIDLRGLGALNWIMAAVAALTLVYPFWGAHWLVVLVFGLCGTLGTYGLFNYRSIRNEYVTPIDEQPGEEVLLETLSGCDYLTFRGRARIETALKDQSEQRVRARDGLYRYDTDESHYLYNRHQGTVQQFDDPDELGRYLAQHHDDQTLRALHPGADAY